MLNYYGEIIQIESPLMIRMLQEGLGGIKDVILDTNQKFFGDSFHFARIPRGEDLSPWAPIIHGTIHSEGDGSRVVIELKPHPSARTLGGVYAFFGLLVVAAAALGLSQGQPLASVGLGFGILLLFFPSFRARYSFRVACSLAMESLCSVVPQSSEEMASSTMSSGSDQRA